MQGERVFTTTIDVPNVFSVCADLRPQVLRLLREAFDGRCFRDSFIVRVSDIVELGRCVLSRSNNRAEGRIDVQFLAAVRTFVRSDILVGVRVLNVDRMIIGECRPPAGPDAKAEDKAPQAMVTFRPLPSPLRVGQLVPVRVLDTTFTKGHPIVAIYGTLLVADTTPPSFRLKGALDPAAALELEPMARAIEAELAARAALVAARREDLWFFESLLYPYRFPSDFDFSRSLSLPAWPDGPSWAGPVPPPGASLSSGEAVSALELVRRASSGRVPVVGVWSRAPCLFRSSPMVAVSPDSAPGTSAAAATPRAVFAEFLKSILDHLVAVRELVAAYPSLDMIKAHANVWAAMRAAQLPL